MQEDTISAHSWKIALLGASLLLSIGAVGLIALAQGLADPPYAGELHWQTQDLTGWTQAPTTGTYQRLTAPFPLPNGAWTLEVQAATPLLWGIWLADANQAHHFMTDGIAYLSVGPDDQAHWTEFIHIQPRQLNILYLHHDDEGLLTFRINEEIAWQGEMAMITGWGVLHLADSPIPPMHIRLYHP